MVTATSCSASSSTSAVLRRRLRPGKSETVADRHPALHGRAPDPLTDQLDGEGAQLAGLVEMDVDPDAVPFRQPEHHVQLPDRVAVERARVDPADQVCAGEQRLLEEIGGPGRPHHPRLRERHHLDPGTPGVVLPCGEHTFEPLQSRVGIDLGVAAHQRRPGGDGATQGVGGAFGYARFGGSPIAPVVLHEPGQPGPGGVLPEWEAEPGGVEVGVGVDEGREQHAGGAVGYRCAVGCRRRRPDGGDAAVTDEDVGDWTCDGARPSPHVAQQQVGGRHRPTLRFPNGWVTCGRWQNRAMRHWLVKSEPGDYSIDDLERDGWTHWDGVRNYQARNAMGEMAVGDRVLFYHSAARPPGVVGLAEVIRESYPDFTAWDPASRYHDPASTPDAPRWFMVDLSFVARLPRLVGTRRDQAGRRAGGDGAGDTAAPVGAAGDRLRVRPDHRPRPPAGPGELITPGGDARRHRPPGRDGRSRGCGGSPIAAWSRRG